VKRRIILALLEILQSLFWLLVSVPPKLIDFFFFTFFHLHALISAFSLLRCSLQIVYLDAVLNLAFALSLLCFVVMHASLVSSNTTSVEVINTIFTCCFLDFDSVNLFLPSDAYISLTFFCDLQYICSWECM
jgi:hypothetical protein